MSDVNELRDDQLRQRIQEARDRKVQLAVRLEEAKRERAEAEEMVLALLKKPQQQEEAAAAAPEGQR